jgi:hypothetical protein
MRACSSHPSSGIEHWVTKILCCHNAVVVHAVYWLLVNCSPLTWITDLTMSNMYYQVCITPKRCTRFWGFRKSHGMIWISLILKMSMQHNSTKHIIHYASYRNHVLPLTILWIPQNDTPLLPPLIPIIMIIVLNTYTKSMHYCIFCQ